MRQIINKIQPTIPSLFLSMLYLSAFTFGGGYVIVTLMKKKFVDKYHWISEKEMLEITAIAQSAPGAIAVNGAIILGYRIAGMAGAAVSVLGTILPPIVILSLISLFYDFFRDNIIVSQVLAGMQAGVAAVIADVVIEMGSNVIKEKNVLSILIMFLVFTASYILKINVIYIILFCIGVGILRGIWNLKRGTTK